MLKGANSSIEGGKWNKEKRMVRGHAKAELLRQLRKGLSGSRLAISLAKAPRLPKWNSEML